MTKGHIFTVSLPALPAGTNDGESCCYCKKNEWQKRSARREYRDMSGGWYQIPVEWEITTWICANPQCERKAMRQSERMVGAYE